MTFAMVNIFTMATKKKLNNSVVPSLTKFIFGARTSFATAILPGTSDEWVTVNSRYNELRGELQKSLLYRSFVKQRDSDTPETKVYCS